jgi:biopolymer transport protein ExbB/TolQ
LALLVALYKWVTLTAVKKPSKRQLQGLFEAVERFDVDDAKDRAHAIRGPVGQMFRAGVDHLSEPKELVEEVLFERVLTSRLRLQSMLPFIAICAASAPLLGLLGTVTGIINTFKIITEFGSGDVKSLSGGISEALITTKFGLIVAIPSLLLHAYLSRKAKSVVSLMETSAVSFVNHMSLSPNRQQSLEMPEGAGTGHQGGSHELKDRVHDALTELLGSGYRERLPKILGDRGAEASAVRGNNGINRDLDGTTGGRGTSQAVLKPKEMGA